MTALALLLALAVSQAPCQPVEPAPVPDPATAATYRRVGDAELAAGARDTAAAAYRKAAALDPGDEASRRALRDLCLTSRPAAPDDFRQGLELMDRNDLRAAAEAFRRARAGAPDGPAALLEGVCLYRLGDDAAARLALDDASRDPSVQDSARFYLGLIALRHGDSATAAPLFESLTSSYGTVAADMALLARRTGILTVSALALTGWNSNVTLAPNGFATTGASDGFASFAASALWRPTGESGPYARVAGTWQQQFTLTAFDMGTASGALGWQLGHADRALVAEYAYTFSSLGGAPYLSANRLLGSGWLTWGSFQLSATWLGRFENYLSVYEPFSGFLQWAEVKGSWWFGPFARLGASYRLGTDSTSTSYLSWLEHGPHVELQWQLLRSLRLGVEATLGFRTYGAVAPGPGVVRVDTSLSGAAGLEYDLGAHWALQATLTAWQSWSNLPQFTWLQVVPSVGVAWLAGF